MTLFVHPEVSLEEARSLHQTVLAGLTYFRQNPVEGIDLVSQGRASERLSLRILSQLWDAAMALPEGDPLRAEIAEYGDDLYDASLAIESIQMKEQIDG